MNEKHDFIIKATLFELKENPDLINKISRRKLLNIAYSRLKGAGFLKECTRCGGSGNYGHYAVYGGTCFKCGGSGYMIPRYTNKWKESVLAYDWRKYMARKAKQREV